MSGRASFWADRRGAAAVELALVLPMMLILLCSVVEVANYAFDEHRLLRGLRDGARYAGRQDLSNFSSCTGTLSTATGAGLETANLVRTGTIDASGSALITGFWDNSGVTITRSCRTTVTADGNGAVAMNVGGIYSGSGYGAPVVTVSADVPYYPVLHRFGFTGFNLRLKGSEQAAVSGA